MVKPMDKFINGLMKTDTFQGFAGKTEIIQTHISMVFLTDQFAYKIKKPVDFGFLDFSTLEKRRYYCNQEVKLNRRFSKDIYIQVLPILYDGKDYKVGEGRGEVVEYAVKMNRIPEKLIMKSEFETGRLTKNHLSDVAETLVNFHQTADWSPEIERFGEPDIFKITTDENFEQTERYIDVTLDRECFSTIRHWTNDFFQKNRDLFYERIRDRKIRDCHGDLHMEHILLSRPVSMFDCIEFNDRFRYTDTFADVGFLLMDLEFHGGNESADILWNLYSKKTMEDGLEHLMTFYKVYRAYVRGKVNSFQINDTNIPTYDKEKAIKTAQSYFHLALSYVRQ
ncbi:MAG: hypothetical protein JW882_21630 [Deltaproteobacteria bacterium]|nr:hypothetical protein [Deltaproteobacteria bacterium]